MLADKPTELSRIKQKTWIRQPVPMISEHSAHLTPLSFDFRTWLWRYTCLLLLISMPWHRQVIFKSKGDKLCSSAKCRIWTLGPRHQIASRLNACWQTDWAIEDQAKNLNSTARPFDQRAFSPLDPSVSWLSHLALTINLFVVVNFDALAQASDIQIERRQVVFLCRMQDLNPGFQTPNRQQTECSTTRPYDQLAFSPLDPTAVWHWHLALAIYMFVVNFDVLAQASDIQIERRQVVFLCRMQDLNPGSQTPNRQQTECLLTNRLSYRGSSKKLELDSPSLWSASIQPTWPLRQLTFAPGSGDKLICCCSFRCSGTGKRYSNRKETSCVPLQNAGFEPGVPDTKSPADWMLADKPTELSRIKQKTWIRQPVPMISEHSAHLTPLSVDFRTWLWR